MKSLYRGFSTKNWLNTGELRISDIECVKQDLLNHIYTVKGERVMMPSFGTRIPLMTFEQNDEQTRQAIEDDLRSVIAYDPRVQLLDLSVLTFPDNNAIVAIVDLLYVEFNVRDTIHIEVN